MSAAIEQEFQEIDATNDWQARYLEIRHKSSDYPHRVAKYPENRNRNRYRDVSPYDHSRVKLQNTENDYINASLVVIEEAQRYYILTQGPLPNTCCHFWLMVWQQQTKAVVMLNRIVEKESVKCAQYWPTKKDDVMTFNETGFRVRLVSEDVKSYYTVHLLQLENINSGESRMISHFHYTTWPDFGVPESPASFLNFLFKVRESGSLSPEHGPAVVHCSAGIGRSGTFSLVDTCLVLVSVCILSVTPSLVLTPCQPSQYGLSAQKAIKTLKLMTFQWKFKLRHHAFFFLTYFDGKTTALEIYKFLLEYPRTIIYSQSFLESKL
uniref:protein-tyrosine-phosphatase n=1 Tax=Zonotrichia albicollis TaxID=44394 RepID=A0A8D2NF38_ZONAL